MTESRRNEATITEDDIREEHLGAVNVAAHWVYLFSVLGISFLLMVGLIAILGR